MSTAQWLVLVRCDGCQTPLIIQNQEDNTVQSCAALTMLGRHYCAECSELVCGINLYPGFLLLTQGLSDQKGYGWS